jgi:sialate O-acetylesterase
MKPTSRAVALCLASSLLGAPSLAAVKLPALFADNMMVQRDAKFFVWGIAEPGEKIAIRLADRKASATAGDDGKWKAALKPVEAGGPFELVVSAANTITIHNVLAGDVWVASGQSNMAWPVRKALSPETEIAAADYPRIRLFSVRLAPKETPQPDVKGQWDVCSPATIPNFSAVGFYFGRELHKTLGVPIGIINTAVGATPADAWTDAATLRSDPDFKPILDRWDQAVADFPRTNAEYQQKLAEWKEASKKAEAEKTPPPKEPQMPYGPGHPDTPSGLYNGMIAPLIPYAIKGVIWYQGESNALRAHQYRKLFPDMIEGWRHAWGQGDFPFLFVQLANFVLTVPQPSDSTWAEMREAQLMTLSLPNTGMAVAVDVGEQDDIHPKNKQEVGRRLALAAEGIVYRKKMEYSGPMLRSMSVKEGKAVLRFDHVGAGIVAKGGGPLKGFAVAGADRKFVWADAAIEGDTIVVTSDKVAEPVAVRYAWANNPVCNLYNADGLPASPFRTDDWPGLTDETR